MNSGIVLKVQGREFLVRGVRLELDLGKHLVRL